MTDPDDALKAALWAELDAIVNLERIQPGDMTVAEFAEHYKGGYSWAKRRLKDLVQAGILTEHRVISDQGRSTLVYRATGKAAG